jgi:hypothetical protein
MKHDKMTSYAERLSAQAEAKKALIAKFQPKPTVTATEFVDRNARREAEREAVRTARAAEREAARVAREAAEAAARQAAIEAEQSALAMKKNERKERKALEKSDAQARKAARMAMFGRAAKASLELD